LAHAAAGLLVACTAQAAEPDNAVAPAAAASVLVDDADKDAPPPLSPAVPRPLTRADQPPPNVFAALSVLPRTHIDFGRDRQAARGDYRVLIEREAAAHGVPPALLDAVMAVESGYNPAVVGADGEIGLMQVMPATARMMGFVGSDATLADPAVNIHYGAEYLAGAWRLAGEDLCTAAMKYRAGHGETRFSFKSVDYCVRVRNHLVAGGVTVKGEVPRPTFGMQAGAQAGTRTRSRLGGSGGRSVDLAALNARLRALTDAMAPRGVR
jgi:soluble lytic murein transglycosylase-like protein